MWTKKSRSSRLPFVETNFGNCFCPCSAHSRRNSSFFPTRPAEELYLYGQDRWQTKSLFGDSKHAETLKQHRARLDRWIEATGDHGPETPEVYVLETEDQVKSTQHKASRENYRKNAELYNRWAREGK